MPRSLEEVEPALLALLKRLARGQEPWPLFLFGDVGTGKTCAALAVADRVAGETWFRTVREHCRELRIAGNGQLLNAAGYATSEQALWKAVSDAELAVLDELGTRQAASDAERDTVQEVIDCREGKPLIALSNLDPDALAEIYDDRVADRLTAGTVFFLDGPSRRREGRDD